MGLRPDDHEPPKHKQSRTATDDMVSGGGTRHKFSLTCVSGNGTLQEAHAKVRATLNSLSPFVDLARYLSLAQYPRLVREHPWSCRTRSAACVFVVVHLHACAFFASSGSPLMTKPSWSIPRTCITHFVICIFSAACSLLHRIVHGYYLGLSRIIEHRVNDREASPPNNLQCDTRRNEPSLKILAYVRLGLADCSFRRAGTGMGGTFRGVFF